VELGNPCGTVNTGAEQPARARMAENPMSASLMRDLVSPEVEISTRPPLCCLLNHTTGAGERFTLS